MEKELVEMFKQKMKVKEQKGKNRPKKERSTKEERILKLHEAGLDVSQIVVKCHTNKEFVCAVLMGQDEKTKKRKRKEETALKKKVDIWEIEREFREGNYRRVCTLAEGDKSALSVEERKSIAELQKEAKIRFTIEKAKKEGKDAAQVAQSLGIPVTTVVNRMGIKVEQKNGRVVYKSKESFWEERG